MSGLNAHTTVRPINICKCHPGWLQKTFLLPALFNVNRFILQYAPQMLWKLPAWLQVNVLLNYVDRVLGGPMYLDIRKMPLPSATKKSFVLVIFRVARCIWSVGVAGDTTFISDCSCGIF